MPIPGPLRAELFRYRRRKGLSLGGGAGGNAPADRTPASTRDPALALDLPHQQHDYDPIHAAYQQMAREYEPPDHPDTPAAWFEGLHHRRAPLLRLDPIDTHHLVEAEAPTADVQEASPESQMAGMIRDQAELTALFIDLYNQAAPSDEVAAEAEALDAEAQSDALAEGLAPDYEAGLLEPDTFGGPSLVDDTPSLAETLSALEAIVESQSEPVEPDLMPVHESGLEAILMQDEPAPTDAAAIQPSAPQPEPDPDDPLRKQQQLYDPQLEQMLNPYMLSPGAGAGLGAPFGPGPMMGPG